MLLASGIRPCLASWGLIVNLVMATLGGHRFWEEDDEQSRMSQRIQFMKNMSLMGGLFAIIAAEGRKTR